MVPVKLSLRNFLCYRDNLPPLSFDGIHLACLSGDNGHGKSALLDAVTWALWGEARAKSDDELIHLGQTEMEVDFEFTLGVDLYRVIRKRAKPKADRGAGQTLLEFQIAGDNGFRSISGNSVRETQKKIIEVLRMDYQTFINSAFLLQGRADEFTVKPPSERKKVLADILGLWLYDNLEDRAKAQAKERESQRKELAGSIEEIDRELAHRPDYETELQEVRALLADMDARVKSQQSAVDLLYETKRVLDLKAEQSVDLGKRIDQTQKEVSRLEAQIAEYQKNIERYEQVLRQRDTVEDGYTRLVAAREANERLNKCLTQWVQLKEKKSRLEFLVEKEKSKLLLEKSVMEGKVDCLEPKVTQLDNFVASLERSKSQLEALNIVEESIREKRKRSQDLSNEVHYLKTVSEGIIQEGKLIKEKLDLLAHGDAKCPLCETDLGVHGRERIEAKYEADRKAKLDSYRANDAEIKAKALEQASLDQEINRLESALSQDKIKIHGQIASLEREVNEARVAKEGLALAAVRLDEIRRQVEKCEYAVEEQKELLDTDGQLAALAYDEAEHRAVQRQVTELEKFQQLHQQLDEAERFLAQQKTSMLQAEEMLGRWRRMLESDVEKRDSLAKDLVVLPEILRQIAEAQQKLAEYNAHLARYRQLFGAVQQKLDSCVSLEKTKKEKTEAIRRLAEEKSVYDELAVAFGKKGIQALIIESVIPEIQNDANELLQRMTNNRMSLKIEAQRAPKKATSPKGETEMIETLDIMIQDELGRRAYELYSGGEAFRANFALRIALSKLLARRAGAPLPTLVIDEGFGTQDSSGRDKLIEAINSIQDDFEKILVVTHIEDLKDAFPVRIEVTKTEEGSIFRVS